MRQPHYLSTVNSQEYPRHCVWVDTETDQVPINQTDVKHVLNFGWACYRRRSRGHRWSKPEWYRFTSIDQFWLWLTEHIGPKESYTIFAHNWGFDFPVLQGFDWLQNNEWELKTAVVDSPPVILKYRKDGRTLRFIDTLNIWRMSLKQLGKSVGIDKREMPDTWDDENEADEYCKRDVEIIMLAIIKWFEFLRVNEFGGFAPTLASQALKTYRHRFMHHDIFIDSNETALGIARSGYYGGRTECFYRGEIKERLYQLDVNSMYPAVMRDNPMPTKLIGVYKRVNHLELRKIICTRSAMCDVSLNTDEPVYPTRQDGRLIFPVGEFRTVLSTPELAYALDHGHVKHINQVALYNQDVIFSDYINYLYNLRLKAKQRGDDAAYFYIKIMLNSLYGKFGQRGRVYETIDNVDSHDIATWVEIDADTMTRHAYRQFGGMVQKLTDEPESRESHPAIAAHVTAFARMELWRLYNVSGRENLFYSDTDCVVVNQVGFDNLDKHVDSERLGALKLEGVINSGHIYGAKDYVFDYNYKLKGVRSNALWLSPNQVEQDQWVGLKGMIARGDVSAPITKRIIKNLSREYKKGTTIVSGRVVPLVVGL